MVCAGIRAPNQAEASSGCFEDASLATDNPTDRTACYAKKDQNAKPSQSDYRIHLPMTRRIPFAVDCAGEQNHQLGNSTPKAAPIGVRGALPGMAAPLHKARTLRPALCIAVVAAR